MTHSAAPHQPTVCVERAPRPTIWLDTNVLIQISKAAIGERADARAVALGKVIAAQVHASRLLCVDAEQRTEMMDSPPVNQALDRLSLGAQMRSFHDVEGLQLIEGMRAQLAASDSLPLPGSIFYERDPADEVDKALKRRFIVTAQLRTPPGLLAMRATSRSNLHNRLEQLRREKRAAGVSFENQLELEYGGRLTAIRACIRELQEASDAATNSMPDAEKRVAIERGMVAVGRCMDLRAIGASMDQVLAFLDASSAYRRSLPIEDVHSQLYARLVTQPAPIEGSDAKDVDHMALVVPVVSFVVTDVVLKNAIRQLRLDTKYECKVFSLRDTDELIEELQAL